MFRLIGFIVKTTLFALIVLILGQLLSWNGKSVSDQIKTQLSQAEHTEVVQNIKGWTQKLTLPKNKTRLRQESISISERQKLKSLIRELNSNSEE